MKNTIFTITALTFFLPILGVVPILEAKEEGKRERILTEASNVSAPIVSTQGNSLLPLSSHNAPARVVGKLHVIVTAYSSTPEQTDNTPFITASGKHVRNGIVATNLLPLGTKIKIPTLYEDRVFVVEDRMHPRNSQNVDIWFPTYWDAKTFGVKYTHIEILGG
ncbi:MAG: hypothetical protein AAB567_02450 [Patescibacteria group bacterium]